MYYDTEQRWFFTVVIVQQSSRHVRYTATQKNRKKRADIKKLTDCARKVLDRRTTKKNSRINSITFIDLVSQFYTWDFYKDNVVTCKI